MFYRRIYYDKTTGGILDSRMAKGDIRVLTQAEEFAAFSTLAGYTAETAGVLEWTEPDAAVEAQFEAQRLERIDVTEDLPVMVFGPFPEPEQDELVQALEALGVEVESNETN